MKGQIDALARRAADGDEAAFESLMEALGGRLRYSATRYYLPGGEREDIIQHARIGLWKAVRDWDPQRPGGAQFRTFAALCMDREVITAVKMATTAKHSTLNGAWVPGEGDDFDPEDPLADPARVFDGREDLRTLFEVMAVMSSLEQRALWLVEGCDASYEQAAQELSVSVKAVDNAIQRARRKLAAGWELASLPAVYRCDICDDEIEGRTRCRDCEDEIEWAKQFVAA